MNNSKTKLSLKKTPKKNFKNSKPKFNKAKPKAEPKVNTESLKARIVAFNVLLDIFKNKRAFDMSFDHHCKELSKQDKAFAFALLNFVLRHLAIIDYIIEDYMDSPYEKTSPDRQVLRLGLAQLFFMDSVEEFACIHTTVDLAKLKLAHQDKTVNAIMRRAQREAFSFIDENYEMLYQLPKWIDEKLTKDYPQRAYSLKTAMLSKAKVHVRLRTRAAQEFIKQNAQRVKALPGAWELTEGVEPHRVPGIRDGFSVYVQDVASQLVGHILATKIEQDGNFEKEINLLDMCAAPGGKTIHLADLLPYANITACDNSESRLKTLKHNVDLALDDDHKVKTVISDATKPEFEENSFDYILLDAPCSGLGISRKHIDVIHLRTEKELEKIVKLQQEILPQALKLLKPGGVMMYSTCSLFKDEGERQIDAFAKENDVNILNIADVYDEIGKVDSRGMLRTFPTDGLDGFFMCLIEKK